MDAPAQGVGPLGGLLFQRAAAAAFLFDGNRSNIVLDDVCTQFR
jgi:hypothetical protein